MIQKHISSKTLSFGKNFVNPDTIFVFRTNVIGIVSPNSQAEGNLWICARRSAKKLKDLTEKETLDLWMTAHEVAKKLEEILYKKGCQIFLQDNVEIPGFEHIFVEITPNFQRNSREGPRSTEEMKAEAAKLQNFFDQCYN